MGKTRPGGPKRFYMNSIQIMARESGDPLALAFDKMVLGGAMMDRLMPRPTAEPPDDWANFLTAGTGRPAAAYVNIPFCPSLCSFCGFFKTAFNEQIEEKYIEALLAEIEREGRAARTAGLLLSAVYIGGGTPTVLSAAALEKLLAAINGQLPLAGGCEITVESRLSTLTDEKLAVIECQGVNRLSIGVQSFDDDVRRRVGRFDSFDRIRARLKRISKTIPLLVLDLIYGLPGQSLEKFDRDLGAALDSGAKGLALYMLKLGPLSPLAKKIKDGAEESPPILSEMTRYYQLAVERLRAAGLRQISNCHWTFEGADGNVYNHMCPK